MNNIIFQRIFSSIVLLPLVLKLTVKNNLYFNLFLLFCLLASIKEWVNISYKKSFFIFGNFFLIFSFLNAYFLRNADNGLFLFLFVMVICICTDLGGYIIGNLVKGPKLTKISPKKTYSGCLGGFIFSYVGINIYFFISQKLLNVNVKFDLSIFFTIFLISAVSQIGDLIVSYFKRRSNLKDTGKLIPGHGGLLDRIDGIIFAIPFYNFFYLINF